MFSTAKLLKAEKPSVKPTAKFLSAVPSFTKIDPEAHKWSGTKTLMLFQRFMLARFLWTARYDPRRRNYQELRLWQPPYAFGKIAFCAGLQGAVPKNGYWKRNYLRTGVYIQKWLDELGGAKRRRPRLPDQGGRVIFIGWLVSPKNTHNIIISATQTFHKL